MMIAPTQSGAVAMADGSFYLAWPNLDARKFLAGAFFVSSGIPAYLALAGVSVPLLGTGFVETRAVSGARAVVHLALFVICVYFGFFRKNSSRSA